MISSFFSRFFLKKNIVFCVCVCVCVCFGGGERRACVRSKRPRVHGHHAHMLKHMCAWCQHTGRRFERAHGGVSESTYGTTPRPQRHTPHNTTTHNTTRRHRQRETEKEGRERRENMKEETRQNNRRQKQTGQHEREERRQKITFQCGGA